MAKISKFSKWSEVLHKNIEADVYYHLEKSRHSGSSGFFFVVIPDAIKDLYETFKYAESFYNRGRGKIIIRGATADDVMARFVEYHEMYKQAKSVTEKVIMYRFTFSSKNKSSEPPKKGYSSMDGVSHTFEAKIKFDFCVCEKTKFGGKISYKALDEDKKTHFQIGRDQISDPVKKAGKSYGGWVELAYSAEREAFFQAIYSGMEGIMDKLMKYIGTEEVVLQSITNHQKLLS